MIQCTSTPVKVCIYTLYLVFETYWLNIANLETCTGNNVYCN